MFTQTAFRVEIELQHGREADSSFHIRTEWGRKILASLPTKIRLCDA